MAGVVRRIRGILTTRRPKDVRNSGLGNCSIDHEYFIASGRDKLFTTNGRSGEVNEYVYSDRKWNAQGKTVDRSIHLVSSQTRWVANKHRIAGCMPNLKAVARHRDHSSTH